MILASIEFNKSINSKEFDKSYLALSKILHSDMRDFFQTDFGKEYYQKWLKEHGKNKPKYTQYDYEEDFYFNSCYRSSLHSLQDCS